MSNQGWISLHRQIQDNFLWQDKPFAKGQAWIDLLLLAYHEDTQRMYRGELKTYHAGEVSVSLSFLADRWGWTWRKVKRFIVTLENAGMVTSKVSKRDTTIFLVKYSNFQLQRRTDGRTESISESRTEDISEDIQSIMINNNNNYNKGAHAPKKKSVKKKNYMDSWIDALQAVEVEEDDGEPE